METEKKFDEIEKTVIKLDICKYELSIITEDLRFAKSQQWSYLYFTILAISAITYVSKLIGVSICMGYLSLLVIIIGFFGILTISIHCYAMNRYRNFSEIIRNSIEQIYFNMGIKENLSSKDGSRIREYIYDLTRGTIFYLIFMIVILFAVILSLRILENSINYISIIMGWLLILVLFNFLLKPIILKTKKENICLKD